MLAVSSYSGPPGGSVTIHIYPTKEAPVFEVKFLLAPEFAHLKSVVYFHCLKNHLPLLLHTSGAYVRDSSLIGSGPRLIRF